MPTMTEAGLVIAIFGPTASGKSAVADALAASIPAELVSADSMQAYAGLPILTNQSEQPVRLVGMWPLAHEGSVGEYQRLAHAGTDEILSLGRTPIVVGGTGLYLRAALADLDIPPSPPPGSRERWEETYRRLGPERTHELLAGRDPAAAAAVHPNDARRVVRALELHETGSSLRPEQSLLWTEETRHPTLIIGLDVPRDVLHERISARTHKMFERGVQEEVRRALEQPIGVTAGQIIGLRSVAELPPEAAVAELERQTRRYAAYQRKWLRRLPGVVTLRADRPAGEVADEILEVARARQRLPARRAG
jgi:tRNA dimethylallyltransferase